MKKSPSKVFKSHSYWGWGNIYQFTSLASSNTFLKENLNKFNPFDVIWVLDQWDGKGKYSNKWYGHKNESLTFSILLADVLKNYSTFALTQLIALAVSEALEHWNITSSIKFPNDILINNKKVAGILIEACYLEKPERFFVIGIGINVNFKKKHQEIIEQNFTSVSQYSSHKVNIKRLLEKILFYVRIYLQSWQKNKFKEFIEKWKFKSTLLNKYVKIMLKDNDLVNYQLVKITNISKDCDLLVLLKNGKTKKIKSSSVLY